MYATLTNLTDEPEAAADPDGHFAAILHSHTPFDLRDDSVDVLVIGDKPDLRETIRAAAQALAQVARDLIERVLGRKAHAEQRTGKPEDVRVNIANHGANAIRVILGDGVTDFDLVPGSARTATAAGYLELRELGNTAATGGTPD